MAIITISRGTMSGGQALADCLASKLGYPRLGREVIQEAAAGLGVSAEALGRTMEDAPTLWNRHSAERKVYLAAVQAALADHLLEGNLVYHGLAGQLLLRDLPAILRVRLIAPIPVRVRALMDRHQMDRASAEQFIRHVDEARARWVRMMYAEDIEDPALYDMVINLDTISVSGACAIVTATVQQPDYAVTDEVKQALQDFALTCRVRTALVTSPETRPLVLEVQARGGAVEVSGSIPRTTVLLHSTGRIERDVARVIRAVPGVDEVRLSLQRFDPYHV